MLLVDDRVGSRDLADPLRKLGLPVEVVRLEYADVALIGRGNAGVSVNVGVELKNISDLVSSLRTGRLAGHQVPGLVAQYDYCWLVVEGDYRVTVDGYPAMVRRGGLKPLHGHMTLDEMEGRLLTLELEAGLHIRHTSARWQTLRFLQRLYRWWTDVDRDEHRSHLVAHVPTGMVAMSKTRQSLLAWPGIGHKAAIGAERTFKTVRRAATATVDEWAEVPVGERRLGKKAAATVVRFCQEGE